MNTLHDDVRQLVETSEQRTHAEIEKLRGEIQTLEAQLAALESHSTPGLPDLLSPAEVATAMRCSEAHVRDLCRSNVLEHANIATPGARIARYTIRRSAVIAYLVRSGLSAESITTSAISATVTVDARRNARRSDRAG